MAGLASFAALAIAVPVTAHQSKPTANAPGALAPAAWAAAAVVDAFHAALAGVDNGRAAALLADDALIYESGGAERSKAEYASHHLAADAAFTKAVRRTVIRRTGHANDEFAWVATESTSSGTYKNRAIKSNSTETMVLRRTGADWRIVHIHWSSGSSR